MSMALFLNTEGKISGKELFVVDDFLKKNGVQEVSFCSSKRLVNMNGENYYFDSMWTPFLKPLNEFKESNIDRYNDFLSLFEAIKDIIRYLLNEGHKIKLFFASVEDKEILIKGQARLKFSDINEYRSFEWGTICEIGK